MPTFDFQCTKGHTFEASIAFGSKKKPACPTCKAPSKKLLSPPLGIHFKGSGFYKTDSTPKEKPAIEPPKKDESKPKKEAA